jgi:glucose/mannose-6-phosphate isomerase
VLPEAGHNQLVMLDGVFSRDGEDDGDLFRDRVEDPDESRRLRFVMFRDTQEHPRVRAGCEAAMELVSEHGIPVNEIVAEGSGPLTRLASLVGLGDYTSVYLAVLLGIDPTPVGPIVQLKARTAS